MKSNLERVVHKKLKKVKSLINGLFFDKLLSIAVTKRTKAILEERIEIASHDTAYSDSIRYSLYEEQIKPHVINRSIHIDNFSDYVSKVNKLNSTSRKILDVVMHEILYKTYMRTEWKDFEKHKKEYLYSNLVFMPYKHYLYLCKNVLHIPTVVNPEFSKAMKDLIDVELLAKHEDGIQSLYHFNIYHMYSHDRAVTVKHELLRRNQLRLRNHEQQVIELEEQLVDTLAKLKLVKGEDQDDIDNLIKYAR